MEISNIFHDSQAPETGERFDAILTHKNLVIERILSSSHIESQEYLQVQDEWVLLLQGEARLEIADQLVSLTAGDYVFLPSTVAHKVLSVSQGAIWLAIHLH